MVDYDKKRLKNDADYRQQVLDEIAGETRKRLFRARLKAMIITLVSIVLFTTGLFIGGLLEYSMVRWVTLFIVCFLIIPIMAWMLVDVHNHRSKQKETSVVSDPPGGIPVEEVNE